MDGNDRSFPSIRPLHGRKPSTVAVHTLAALPSLVCPCRTIRYYLQQGVLSRPTFHGTATRYGREHLLRLLGVERLKREGLRKLSTIKQRLDAAGEAQLLAAVAAQPPSAAVAAALGLPPSSPSTSQSGPGVASVDRRDGPKVAAALGEPWRRIQLLPGLELLLAETASPAVRQIALQMQAHCAAR